MPRGNPAGHIVFWLSLSTDLFSELCFDAPWGGQSGRHEVRFAYRLRPFLAGGKVTPVFAPQNRKRSPPYNTFFLYEAFAAAVFRCSEATALVLLSARKRAGACPRASFQKATRVSLACLLLYANERCACVLLLHRLGKLGIGDKIINVLQR